MRQARNLSIAISSAERAEPGQSRMERRLAAILGLDVQGYSALMSTDEEDTHRRIGAALEQAIKIIQSLQGRVFSFSGDGLMAEFPSSVVAVRAALKIQAGAALRNGRIGAPRRIAFRIGVHVGEILVQAGRIGGDAVNIAARLEQIGEPGAVLISELVHDQVFKVVQARYMPLGKRSLKNIPEPVMAYSVKHGRSPLQSMSATGASRGSSALDELPTIAVLPLDDLSAKRDAKYFSDGIVDDIIVSLSGLRELIVVSRASTQAFADGQHRIQDVGRVLGVRYVLTGSVRRTTRSMRVSVQLSDAGTGASLWADTSNVSPGDLFDVQDEIVRRVVSGIAPQIRGEELRRALRRRPENLNAYHHTLQALHCMTHMRRDSFLEARALLARAMQEDPEFAMPVAWAIWWTIVWIGQQWSDNPSHDKADALDLAERVVALDPRNALGLALHGHLKSYLFRNYDTALLYLERARVAGPSNAIAALFHALTLAYVGRGNQAVECATFALRLSPLDSNMFVFHNVLALANFSAGRFEESVRWGRSSAQLAPNFTANLRTLIAALEAAGLHEEASQVSARLLALEPDFTVDAYAKDRQPFGDPSLGIRFLSGLRASGLPVC